jgi:hypothetical protein
VIPLQQPYFDEAETEAAATVVRAQGGVGAGRACAAVEAELESTLGVRHAQLGAAGQLSGRFSMHPDEQTRRSSLTWTQTSPSHWLEALHGPPKGRSDPALPPSSVPPSPAEDSLPQAALRQRETVTKLMQRERKRIASSVTVSIRTRKEQARALPPPRVQGQHCQRNWARWASHVPPKLPHNKSQ